jgi:hypothetical protein
MAHVDKGMLKVGTDKRTIIVFEGMLADRVLL